MFLNLIYLFLCMHSGIAIASSLSNALVVYDQTIARQNSSSAASSDGLNGQDGLVLGKRKRPGSQVSAGAGELGMSPQQMYEKLQKRGELGMSPQLQQMYAELENRGELGMPFQQMYVELEKQRKELHARFSEPVKSIREQDGTASRLFPGLYMPPNWNPSEFCSSSSCSYMQITFDPSSLRVCLSQKNFDATSKFFRYVETLYAPVECSVESPSAAEYSVASVEDFLASFSAAVSTNVSWPTYAAELSKTEYLNFPHAVLQKKLGFNIPFLIKKLDEKKLQDLNMALICAAFYLPRTDTEEEEQISEENLNKVRAACRIMKVTLFHTDKLFKEDLKVENLLIKVCKDLWGEVDGSELPEKKVITAAKFKEEFEKICLQSGIYRK